MLLPLDGIGLVLLSNGDGQGISLQLMALFAVDLMLDMSPWLTPSIACTFPCSFVNCTPPPPPPPPPRPPAPCSSASINDYVGNFTHPTYGTITFSTLGGGQNSLQSIWGPLSGNVIPYSIDLCLLNASAPFLLDPILIAVQVRGYDPRLALWNCVAWSVTTGVCLYRRWAILSSIFSSATHQFSRNYTGQVVSVSIPLEPTVAPIVFTNNNYTPSDCGYAIHYAPSGGGGGQNHMLVG